MARAHETGPIAAPHGRRARSDGGFTLIELLVVTAIIPLIAGALAIALISVLRQQPVVASRVSNSADAQIVSANYVRDVQSSSLLTTSSASQYVACGSGGKQLLGLQIVSASGTTTYVSYQEVTLEAGTHPSYVLNRLTCVGSSNATPFVKRIAADLPAPALQGYATVTCAATVPCGASSGWMPTAGVASVSLAVAAPGRDGGYLYSLNSVPQDWNPASGANFQGGSAIVPFMLINNSNCSSMPTGTSGGWFNISGTGKIVAGGGTGPIADSSTCANSIQLTQSSATVSASQVYSADCPNPQSISSPNNTPEVCQSVPDPLSGNLLLPTSASPTASPTTGCTNVGTTYTCPAGEYAANPSWENTNTANVTFTAGAGNVFIFDQQLSIHNSQVVNFGPGTYWFKGGLLTSGSTTTTLSVGTYLFGLPSNLAATNELSVSNGSVFKTTSAGALVYLEGGSATLGGGSASSLLGQASNFGVAIWDAAPNNGSISTVTVANGASNIALGGIYIPQGKFVLSGNGNCTVPFLITQQGAITGSGSLLVG